MTRMEPEARPRFDAPLSPAFNLHASFDIKKLNHNFENLHIDSKPCQWLKRACLKSELFDYFNDSADELAVTIVSLLLGHWHLYVLCLWFYL